MRAVLVILITATLIISLVGCTSSVQSTVTSSTKTTSIASTSTSLTTSATSAAGTFGSLAQAGQLVYSSSCASCHSRTRVLWGTNSPLKDYTSAQRLMDYISAAMPMNAPGSLSHQDYLNVLSYLLMQNNAVSPADAFSESQLSSIVLK
jgi:mono/diheme cytochrome c family protein